MEEEETSQGLERRTFLKRSAIVAGATVWATPTVQSLMSPAFATGTGQCPPGKLVRFKYDAGGGFDSGVPQGGGASWCLPTGYADADIAAEGDGCFMIDNQSMCITVTISSDGKTATVTIPEGTQIEDLHAKAGSPVNGECDDMDVMTGTTATVTLEHRRISFVAGVICVPVPG